MARVKIGNSSPARSFNGWNLWQFVKGRKKTAVTVVGFLLGFAFSDSATIATVSAAFVEMVFAVSEYYLKERR